MNAEFWDFQSNSENQTAAIGTALGELVSPGLVVALVGNLGAGKTRFVQGVASGLGIDPESVTSPTFVLIHEYPGRLRLHHFDTYRLNTLEDFLDLGAEELFYGDGVCLVEWADRVENVLPLDHLRVTFAIAGPSVRELQFHATGPQSLQVLQALRERMLP